MLGLHDASMAQIKNFRGFNNVSDPLRLGMDWLVQADNVNITDRGALVKRDGYALEKAGAYSAAYGTEDFKKLFLVDGLFIKSFDGTVIASLTSSAEVKFAEINGIVYFSNGADFGIIKQDNSVLEWQWRIPQSPSVSLVTGTIASGIYSVCCTYVLDDGRETGASDPVSILVSDGQAISISSIPHIAGASTRVYIVPANSGLFQLAATTAQSAIVWNASNDDLGEELKTDGFDPIPDGVSSIAFFKGRAYAAQYMPEVDQTAIWFSQPLGFHLFALSSDFFMVQGEVTMLAPTESALIVGSTNSVYSYNAEGLSKIADYGVVPGQNWSKDDNRILFWTTRGVCSALPFTNLTEKSVSVAPGIKAGGTIVRQGGQKRYLAVLQQGGSAFNSH